MKTESSNNLSDSLSQLDAALAGVCRGCPHLADDILEFREHARCRKEPGRCVRAFFDFMGRSERKDMPELFSIREWLCRAVEIAVCVRSHEVERLPFCPEEPDDLETFCRRAIGHVASDRVYDLCQTHLEFRYR